MTCHIFVQTTIWDFVDKKNTSEGQEWSKGQVRIPKASMFKVRETMTMIHSRMIIAKIRVMVVVVRVVMVVTKVLVVADRGEEGTGWAAIDDFEFLYDVFEVAILYVSSSKC